MFRDYFSKDLVSNKKLVRVFGGTLDYIDWYYLTNKIPDKWHPENYTRLGDFYIFYKKLIEAEQKGVTKVKIEIPFEYNKISLLSVFDRLKKYQEWVRNNDVDCLLKDIDLEFEFI